MADYPKTPQGWAMVYSLAAAGIANGKDHNDALRQALNWMNIHGLEIPTIDTALEAFRIMIEDDYDSNSS
jgi:hypothetical protein